MHNVNWGVENKVPARNAVKFSETNAVALFKLLAILGLST